MKVQVVIERDNDGTYTAVIKNQFKNVGFFGNGTTVEEAMDDLRLSESEAREFDPKLPVLEYEVKYDVASFLQYYSQYLTLTGLQKITGVNNKQLSRYATGVSKPTERTSQKIMFGIRDFSQKLNNVSFV